MIKVSKHYQPFFLNPLWAYAIVLISYFSAPALREYLVIGILIFLGFPHFGLTIPIIFSKNWKNYKIELWGSEYGGMFIFIALPTFFLSVFAVFYALDKNIALIVFLIINFFHITRQSEGILKLQSAHSNWNQVLVSIRILRFSNYAILIHIVLTSLGHNFSDSLSTGLAVAWFTLNTSYLAYIIKKRETLTHISCLITSLAIYTPVFFCEKYIEVITLGTVMHYIQYLFLGGKIVTKRTISESNNFSKSFVFIAVFIIIYTIASSVVSFNVRPNNQHLIIIALLAQLYHFITDSFIWRKSVAHNRDNIFKYI